VKGAQNMNLKFGRQVASKERKGRFRTLKGPNECKPRPTVFLSKPSATNHVQHRKDSFHSYSSHQRYQQHTAHQNPAIRKENYKNLMNGMITTGVGEDDIVTGGADCMPVNSKNYSMRSEIPPQTDREQQDKLDSQCESQMQAPRYRHQQPQVNCHPLRYSSDYNNDEAFQRYRNKKIQKGSKQQARSAASGVFSIQHAERHNHILNQ